MHNDDFPALGGNMNQLGGFKPRMGTARLDDDIRSVLIVNTPGNEMDQLHDAFKASQQSAPQQGVRA